MASISPPPTFPPPSAFSDYNPHTLTFKPSRFQRHVASSHRISDAALCRCQGQSDSPASSSGNFFFCWNWDSVLRQAFKSALNQLDSYVNSYKNKEKDHHRADAVKIQKEIVDDKDWDWDQWERHFVEVDEQEGIVSVLKSHLGYAVLREDYEDAARLKVAIAAASTNNIISRVMIHLKSAIKEERYKDATHLRDSAGAGLVGWWSGISDVSSDPYGRIIQISGEHGRYVARCYNPRQLSTETNGVPMFEIFLRMNRRGEYQHQAVYLKQRAISHDSPTISSMTMGSNSSPSGSDSTNFDKSDVLTATIDDDNDEDDKNVDSDIVSKLSNFQNILQDMIPGVKIKVLKVALPGKVDRDFMSKVLKQIIEEDDEKETGQESMGTEDESSSDNDEEKDEIGTKVNAGMKNNEGRSELAVKVIVGGLINKLSGSATENLRRAPAKLVKGGRLTFSLFIENDDNSQESDGKVQSTFDRKAKIQSQRNIHRVMVDLAKSIGRDNVPLKVLRDVGELMNAVLSQTQNPQPLSGLTVFNRIEILESPDPLNGLYIGAHGLYTSEIINLSCKFGQWEEEEHKQSPDVEFYEYVEALKLTGDPYVPAGQVAFRAKVGKKNELPHRGIIPEEFGVMGRYRGQGRVAEVGFKNPRWVDGELVVLGGKYMKEGPVIGFVYWSSKQHFLVFFNRLTLQ